MKTIDDTLKGIFEDAWADTLEWIAAGKPDRDDGSCKHNQRCRFTDGFHCEDCGHFFPKDSKTYRRTELISSLALVCCNISANHSRKTGKQDMEAVAMYKRCKEMKHGQDPEPFLAEAEAFIARHGKNADSAVVVLKP